MTISIKRGVMAASLAVALLALAATGAQASITLSSSTVSDTDTVNVSGSVPGAASGANRVAVSECNTEDATTAAELGERCNEDTAIGFTSIGTFTGSGIDLEVWEEFDDFDFTTQSPGAGSSECDATAGSDPCAVVVSYYFVPSPPAPPIPSFVYAEAEGILFQ